MKTKSKDTAWPPVGVRDLKPDVPVRDKADRRRYPSLREALVRAGAVTPDRLTEQLVRSVYDRARRSRDAEYLCRAYLQFGSEAMATEDLQRLCDVINKTPAGTP